MSPDFTAFRDRFQQALFACMPEHVQRLGWGAEQIATHQTTALRALLAHAQACSPFHARRLRGVDAARFELSDLGRLPAMTKDEMMAGFDDVLTERRLSLATVEETLARTGDTPIPLLGSYACQASGGSSGRRGVFVVDADSLVAFTASLIRRRVAESMRAGGAGAPPTMGLVAAGSAVHATGMPPKMLEGTPLSCSPVPATLPLPEIVERLNRMQPQVLLGYASMLARLAAEQQAGRLRLAPLAVTSTSETLLPEQRAYIRAAFGAPVSDTFGSSEGLVGTTHPDDPVLVFASDLCLVELVDEQNRPVPPGQPSARILVTNLHNRVQPLIRYVIEDSFVREPDAADHGHLRARVQGRADDVLRWGSTDVHPLTIRSVMVKTPAVVDYQVRQTPDGIDVTLVADGPFDGGRLGERLVAALAAAGLRGAVVNVRVAPCLERQAGTGKLRRFVPLRAA